MRAHLVAQILFVPRGAAPPPQFDGRGPQQVLDAAPDRAASLRGHRAVSWPASCLSQRLETFFSVALSSAPAADAAAVMLSANRTVPSRRVQLDRLRFWFWIDRDHGIRCRGCSTSYISATAKTRSGLYATQDRTEPTDAPPASRPHAVMS